MCYMDESNSIVEAEYRNGSWLEPDGQPEEVNNRTSEADKGSPIAALHYKWIDKEYRQIFFYNSAGRICTMNVTDNGSWDKPYVAVTTPTHSDAKGLAACVGSSDKGLYGIRVYMAYEDSIAELGFGFGSSEPRWEVHNAIQDSDPRSGVSCELVYNSVNRVYVRDDNTSLLQQ